MPATSTPSSKSYLAVEKIKYKSKDGDRVTEWKVDFKEADISRAVINTERALLGPPKIYQPALLDELPNSRTLKKVLLFFD
jgi:hypothetical protein